jgi:hypothetical protein
MPIDPSRPPQSDSVQATQREGFSSLPDADRSPAFTLGWAELDEPGHPKGLYFNRVTTPDGGHQWEPVGGAASAPQLPDVRFVVGKKSLDLQSPGSATYETIADALAAVDVYQASNPGSPALVLLHPDTYFESATLPPRVSMAGLSAGSNKVIVGGTITIKGDVDAYCSVSALRCERVEIDLSRKNQRVDLYGVEITKGVYVSQSVGSGMANVLLIDCNSISELKASVSEAFIGVYGGAIGGFVVDASAGTCFSRLLGSYLSSSNGILPVQMIGGIGYFIDCVYSGRENARPIATLERDALAYFIGGVRESDSFPYVVTSPDGSGRMYWNNVCGPTGKISIESSFDPNLALKSPMVTADGYAGFAVNVLIDGAAPTTATVPRACETFEVIVSYFTPPSSVLVDNAYAIVRLPSARELLTRKRLKVINYRPLTEAGAGPMAVVPFPGETIGDLTGTAPNITGIDYLILSGGDAVELSSTSSGWRICG